MVGWIGYIYIIDGWLNGQKNIYEKRGGWLDG